MSTIDLSRQLTDPRKHYARVMAQQGRVATDDEYNEGEILAEEELRRTRLHAIGAYGAPGLGFLPKDFTVVGGKLDFNLSAGELYLGGLRLEMSAEERFLEQKDWLNFDPAADAELPPASGTDRIDLAWIEAWQQPVTAVEDSELFEVALGGPDTGARWRTMRRVRLAVGVDKETCADAWAAVAAGLDPPGTLNEEFELTTAATLTVTFTAPTAAGDLCSPPQAGGYLRAENQAIRVQMVNATNYTWGFDNASPLYRVKVSDKGGQLVVLTFLDGPRDAVHWPLKGQVVELLPWSAALANGQRVAELAGHLCKVARSYDPDDRTLEIDVAVPGGPANWEARSDKSSFFDGAPDENFLFLRVWNRGDDLASLASIPIGASNPLGNTGLAIAFNSGPLRPADHWIIAARPAAPNVVTPWQLTLPVGAPPNGVKRYRAPIGLIRWRTSPTGVTTGLLIHDCRPPFLPLTRIRNCCSVTVGDGTESFGMFKSVQAAVESLPPSGGTVCILPGLYTESVRIEGRNNVTLHGCGPRSRIVAREEAGADSTAVHILRSTDICIEALALEGGAESVIRVEESEVVRIASCLVQFRDLREPLPAWSALFLDGRLIEVEETIVEPRPERLDRIVHRPAAADRAGEALAARGGIQLAGGCEQVRLAGNVIAGGAGNGITLGSILRIDGGGIPQHVPDIDIDNPCAPCDPTDQSTPPVTGGRPVRYESAGDLYEIDIEDNVIVRQGANGISVVRFFGPGDDGLTLVTVHGLRIGRNRIVRCLHRKVAETRSEMLWFLGYGGIALAFVTELEIESNVIVGNGRDWLTPVCGIFVLVADGLRIEHNLIRLNGVPGGEPPGRAQQGIRAGVHVWLALSLQAGASRPASDPTVITGARIRRRAGVDQLRVHGNRIEQPLGRALFLLGAGPMQVTDNRLVSEGGGGVTATDPLASTALVANFGISREWNLGLLAALILVFAENDSACPWALEAARLPGAWLNWPTGKLAFNDNQASFLMRDAPAGLEISSVMLLSLDDIAACDNQLEFHTEGRRVLADLLAIAPTVRTSDNRLAETWGRAFSSILSVGLMNSAADNQSTHCLRTWGVREAVHDNLVLAEVFCSGFCSNGRMFASRLATGADVVVDR